MASGVADGPTAPRAEVQALALFDCPECEAEISDRAKSCPHCGLPRPRADGRSPSMATTQPNHELDTPTFSPTMEPAELDNPGDWFWVVRSLLLISGAFLTIRAIFFLPWFTKAVGGIVIDGETFSAIWTGSASGLINRVFVWSLPIAFIGGALLLSIEQWPDRKSSKIHLWAGLVATLSFVLRAGEVLNLTDDTNIADIAAGAEQSILGAVLFVAGVLMTMLRRQPIDLDSPDPYPPSKRPSDPSP